MGRFVLVLLVFVFVLNLASASYISGDIYVSPNGNANFFIETDKSISMKGLTFEKGILSGDTDELTSKNGEVWSFGLNLGYYDGISLNIHLPDNVDSITSLEGVFSFIDVEKKVVIISDRNKALFFRVNYTLREESGFLWVYPALILVFLALISYFVFRFFDKKRKLKEAFPFINENERKIINLIMKNPLRQKEVRKTLGIPKASFSRYVLNLEKKKLLFREGDGKNKILRVR
ncbi:MAG: hypothetical protein KKB62_01650 [Nanoarchaeota archaeon]|nr:hypothetical protein [Nanoarchaeota archaeon]